jgi:tetrahydromethanopterin S-methyltransferase subunit G
MAHEIVTFGAVIGLVLCIVLLLVEVNNERANRF